MGRSISRDSRGPTDLLLSVLQGGGRWSAFRRDCPLVCTGNRGSGVVNVMGTVLLSVLSGHWRYAHINSLRGDSINPGLLGMSSTVSEDAVRQAMGRIEEVAGLDWISAQILGCISPALCLPWILDIDVAVKPLYGRQQLDPLAFPAIVMPKHYGDRADAENCLGELKNRWGWGGFTSHKLSSSRLMANLIALVYNWWNLYGRFYDKENHRETTHSRPMLMSGLGRQVQSGGQRTVKVSVLHEKGDFIAKAVAQNSKEIQQMCAITERWTADQRWALFLTRVRCRWSGGKWLPTCQKRPSSSSAGKNRHLNHPTDPLADASH